MRATIIVDDNTVMVDGVAAPVDCAPLKTDGVHAVQWYENYGEVEFTTTFNVTKKIQERKPNQVIDDFSPYQEYIEAWSEAALRAKLLKEENERRMAELFASPKNQ